MATKLDITKPLKIIGIQIFEESLDIVKKVLRPGWYPFVLCENDPATHADIFPVVDNSGCPKDYYRIDEKNLPRISICAIAGKNGTGKSSLVDIMYRILNNFAEATFLKTGIDETSEIKHAFGVHARLYFELDGVLKFIETGELGTTYYEVDNNEAKRVPLENLSESQRDSVLSGFFYTICINYSLYAFNPKDSFSPFSQHNEEVIENEWINHLFHKNDGYYVPIVLTPFRENGEIDINNENYLAEQRLTTLSLMFHSQNKEFVEDFVPTRFFYRFDYNFKERKYAHLYENPIHPYLRQCQNSLISQLEDLWEKKLLDFFEIELDPAENQNEEIALFYLAYKTLKICSTYPNFKTISKFDELLDLKEVETVKDNDGNEKERRDGKGNLQYSVKNRIAMTWLENHLTSFSDVIEYIIRTKDNHITIKIHQCIEYLKGINTIDEYIYGKDEAVLSVNEDLLKGNRYDTYDSMMMQLPPAFFITELRFKNRNDKSHEPEEITFNSMSSGERQLLFSLSYVFYHIKNIASIKEGGKRVVGYHHINLIFDEAELYYHPEYQRQFVKRLLDCLAMCHINRTNIRSIHIMIITHSPFILSDIPETNILFLRKAEDEISIIPQKTLGANIYDLLKGGFFLDYAMGDFVQQKLQDILRVEKMEKVEVQKSEYLSKRDEFIFTVNHIGEEYLQKSFTKILDRLDEKYVTTEEQRLYDELLFHKEEVVRIQNQLNKK